MRVCNGRTGLALGALLVCGSWVAADPWANDLTLSPQLLDETPATTTTTTTTSAPSSAPTTPPKPLMDLLGPTCVGSALNAANITIGGYVEGSYTYDVTKPDIDHIPGRVFDQYANRGLLNQSDIYVDRPVDLTKWDIGGHFEFLYGTDASFMHSNGLFDWYNSPEESGTYANPENQWDLPQAYVDLAIPVGNGLKIRFGKFYTLLGYESSNPTSNALYSHSYMFNYGFPYTQTGALATYAFNDQWSVTAGATRGWNQSTDDNNNADDFLGQLTYTPNKQWTVNLVLSSGPQLTDNNSDWQNVLDLNAAYTVNDNLTLAVDGAYAYCAGAVDGHEAQWYGVAGYATYKLNDYFSLNGRLEWFRDNDGFVVTDAFGNSTGVPSNYYEATLGLGIHPLPNDKWGQNLVLRPEVRFDYADDATFGDNNHSTVTLAVDAYFTF